MYSGVFMLIALYAMATVRFTGKTVPNVGITATGGPFGFDNPVIPLQVMKYDIRDGNISVECDVPDTSDYALNIAFFYVLPVIRSIADAAAFSKAFGVTIIIDTCIKPDGTNLTIGYHDPTLDGICTLQPIEMLQLNQRERPIFKYLHDLIETLVDPFSAPINCARAVEGFAQLLLPGGKPIPRWTRMQEALNVDESYLKSITEESKGPRHGTSTPPTFGTIFDLRKRAWIIANRFLEFRKRGNVDLTDPDFPRLT